MIPLSSSIPNTPARQVRLPTYRPHSCLTGRTSQLRERAPFPWVLGWDAHTVPRPPPLTTDPFGEARRGACGCCGAHVGVAQAYAKFSFHPISRLQSWGGDGMREPVFLELLDSPLLKVWPLLEPTAPAQPPLFICAAFGTLRGPSLPLSSGKCSSLRGWLPFTPASPGPAILASSLQRSLKNCLEVQGTDCLV